MQEISQALYNHLDSIIEAYMRKDDDVYARNCERLATDLIIAIRRDTVDVIGETVHIHNWEYDDQGGYECSCGEAKRRDW